MNLTEISIAGADAVRKQIQKDWVKPEIQNIILEKLQIINIAIVMQCKAGDYDDENQETDLKLTSLALMLLAGEVATLIQSGTAPAQESSTTVNENK